MHNNAGTSLPGDRGPVQRALDRTSGGRNIPGNRITHLADGPETLAQMVQFIESASRWVHFENYIIRSDRTGHTFGDAFIDAANRGVAVHVLYDPLGSRGTSRGFWKRLRKAGVKVRPFNRLNPFRPIRSVRRNHRKLVSVDGQRAVVGGLCIGDEWAGRPTRGIPPWRDTAVALEGPVVPALDATFARRWGQTGGPLPEGAGTGAGPSGPAAARVVDGIPGKLRLFRTLELLIAGVADRLWITDAYLVAPSPLYAGLLAAARDGVDVRLLVPGRTDIPAIRALTRVGYRELLEGGVRIWESHGPMLHAKTVVVDGTWFKVGSTNLNPSSFLSNHELDLLIEDSEVTTAAAQQFRRDLADAAEIVLRMRRGPARITHRLPPTLEPADDAPPVRGPATGRELTRRAVMTLGQVADGARRSIGGALVFASVGTGVLFAALPRVMGYAIAVISFALGAGAAWNFFRRRAYRRS